MGGVDENSNYYRRVVQFVKLKSFKEIAPMAIKRAFFCSLLSRLENWVYVFGGNNGEFDLQNVEVYNCEDNFWKETSPTIIAWNGASCLIFEENQKIFLFGGSN